jgi:hypothetical protein
MYSNQPNWAELSAIMAPDGTLWFGGTIAGQTVTESNNQVLLGNRDGVTRLLVREGGSDEGAPGSAAVRFVASFALGAWNRGVVGNREGEVWAWDGEVYSPVLLHDTPAPGLPDGARTVLLYYASAPSINSAGVIAVRGMVRMPDVPSPYFITIWRGTPGALEAVWHPYQDTTFLGPDVRVVMASSPIITGSGSVFVVLQLAGPGVSVDNDTCLVVYRAGRWTVIAREGDLIPGGSTNARFGRLSISAVAANRLDQCVFGTEFGFNLCYWDPSEAEPQTILRPGQVVLTDAGASHTVQDFRWLGGSGGQDGRFSALSDSGRLVIRTTFTGNAGSGVISRDLTRPCLADWNTDGGVDGADLHAFFVAWEAGEADANRDGGTDGADVETFMIAWVNGC